MSPIDAPEAPHSSLALVAEDIVLTRRDVTGDTVRVKIVTHQQEQPVDATLTHERVEIQRVPIGRVVDAAPPVRQEGDTTVMSVLEETIVTERRLVLVEEVRIRRVQTAEVHHEVVMVSKQEAVISRTPAESPMADHTKLAQE